MRTKKVKHRSGAEVRVEYRSDTAAPESGDRQLVIVQVDRAKFTAEVEAILDGSSVVTAIRSVAQLRFPGAIMLPSLATTWRVVYAAIESIISAVEIAKGKYTSEGGKFSAEVALDTAVSLVDNVITFSGPVGRLIDLVDGPILRLLIAIILGKRHGMNWTDEAKKILGV